MKAAALDVDDFPEQVDDLAAAATGECDLPDDQSGRRIFILSSGGSQHFAEDTIFSFGQTALPDSVFRLAQSVC